MKRIIRDALVLFTITLISGIMLGLVHEITLEPIAAAKETTAKETYRAAFPQADHFGNEDEFSEKCTECSSDSIVQDLGNKTCVDNARTAYDINGEAVGYVIDASSKGYGGQVQVCVGISNDGYIKGLGFLEINETPGLGMKAKNKEFTDQFTDRIAEENMVIDSISGASKTSAAVSNAVKAAVYFVNNYADR